MPLDVYKRQHLHHIPEFSLLASKSDLYDLHLHHSVADFGEKTEKAADGWVFQIGVAQHIASAGDLQAAKMCIRDRPPASLMV